MRYLLLAALFFCASAQAQCLNEESVQSLIYKNFQVEVIQAGAGSSPGIDICDHKSLAFRTFASLLFLHSLPTMQPKVGDGFDLNRLGPNAFDFFRLHVKKITLDLRPMDDRDTGCFDGRAAYIPPGGRTGGKIIICQALADSHRSLLWSAGVLVHEAWHLNKDDPGHAVCEGGPLAGKRSCDESYESGGSYAAGVEFNIRVYRAPGLDPEIRAEARRFAITDFLERFNKKSFDVKSGALLIDEAGRHSFYDGATQTPISFPLREESLVTTSAGVATFFEPRSGAVESYYFSVPLSPSPRDVLIDIFRLELNAAERLDVKDVFYGPSYACILFPHSLKCVNPQRERLDLGFSHLRAKHFLSSPKSRFIPGGVPLIYAEDGFAYVLPMAAEALQATDPLKWRKSAEPFAFQYLSPFTHGYEIGLSPQGRVSLYSYREKKWVEAKGLDERPYRRMISPFAWSETLNEL